MSAAELSQLTEEQGATVGRLARDFRATDVTITYEPFDLPTGWVLVQVRGVDGGRFTAGVAPEGRAHSLSVMLAELQAEGAQDA